MYEHIMGQTLPAVVSMGVVSRTTDTMFGGKGRRRTVKRAARRTTKRATGRTASSRKSAIPKTHKFDGKVYRSANIHTTKASAERDAQYFRKAGHAARVVYVGGKYVVYVR